MGDEDQDRHLFPHKVTRYRHLFGEDGKNLVLAVLPERLVKNFANHPDTPPHLKKYLLDSIKDDNSGMFFMLDKHNLTYLAQLGDKRAKDEIDRRNSRKEAVKRALNPKEEETS